MDFTIENGVLTRSEEGDIAVIPEGVKAVGFAAFASSDITEVVFPSSLEKLGLMAFDGCERLKQIRFSTGLTVIGPYAFSSCLSLEEIALPAGVKEVGCNAFSFCPLLKTVVFRKGIERIGGKVFEGCTSLEKVVLPPHAPRALCKAIPKGICIERRHVYR